MRVRDRLKLPHGNNYVAIFHQKKKFPTSVLILCRWLPICQPLMVMKPKVRQLKDSKGREPMLLLQPMHPFPFLVNFGLPIFI